MWEIVLVTDSKQSAISNQQSAISYQLSAISYQHLNKTGKHWFNLSEVPGSKPVPRLTADR
ncbi:MAG: hypothetical protein F6K56_22605 [Moorea sp. SIO3G5]|nr:hypothetical protein [Moorena sp. SIO3G5]